MEQSRHINCCQKVLLANLDKLGLPALEAERLGAFFGGGMQHQEVCGAVTASLMVLGAQTDFSPVDKLRAKEFMDRFALMHGSFRCGELISGKDKDAVCPVYIDWCKRALSETRED